MKHEEECFITYPNTDKCVEKTRRSRVFLTHFEVFRYVMKHSSSCFLFHLKQMGILGENWEESWVSWEESYVSSSSHIQTPSRCWFPLFLSYELLITFRWLKENPCILILDCLWFGCQTGKKSINFLHAFWIEYHRSHATYYADDWFICDRSKAAWMYRGSLCIQKLILLTHLHLFLKYCSIILIKILNYTQ